jgi:DNA-binding GntR family transcriptional regulator
VTEVLYPTDERSHVIEQHEAITRAIEARSPKRAETLMRQHMVEYVEYCEKRYPARMDDMVDWK